MSTSTDAYWLSALRLTDFRNYERLSFDLEPQPVVLVGPNGAGKTNLLEAVSFLVPGRGLRAAPHEEIAREGGAGGWTVFSRVEGPQGAADIGTGVAAAAPAER
ncbi:MAG TPA: AAA family ATPase, partial [Hyphomicrobiales bacterium]|nr:AAA family ATPase [Hyphomicrobiales bacterium]